MKRNSCLVLEDGSIFPGISFGSEPGEYSEGEVVFNTGMSGYNEIMTDPSYTGQIVTMTYPHIGNYGIEDAWTEAGPEETGRKPIKIRGLVVRSVHSGRVPAGRKSIIDFMNENGICGISDVDTRALTIKLREKGSLKGCIIDTDVTKIEEALVRLKALPDMQGANLIGGVGTSEIADINPKGKTRAALIDCGIKANIIRELESRNVNVILFPSDAGMSDINRYSPDAVLFSNGPGDPAVLKPQIELAGQLAGKLPLFGICLGHQIISLGLGAETYKMKFGHHGINNPVRDEVTGKVYVSSQNHGFAVKMESLPPDTELWFKNANDGSVEGILSRGRKIAAVQFHPEAAPGPADTAWIFDEFLKIAKGES